MILLNLNAHDSCKDDLSLAYELYDTTVVHIGNKAEKDARYFAKRFQVEAFEFFLLCKEEYKNNDKAHTYKRILKNFSTNEVALYDKGILTKLMLSK